jgi:hypothetical protein
MQPVAEFVTLGNSPVNKSPCPCPGWSMQGHPVDALVLPSQFDPTLYATPDSPAFVLGSGP